MPLSLRAFRHQLPNGLGAVEVPAFSRGYFFGGGGGGHGVSLGVVYHLGINMFDAAKHRQARTLRGSFHLAPNARVNPQPDLILGIA